MKTKKVVSNGPSKNFKKKSGGNRGNLPPKPKRSKK